MKKWFAQIRISDRGKTLNVDRQFRRSFRRAVQETDHELALLPSALTLAAVATLPQVAGASLSVLSESLRIPLGSSDSTSAVAESLEMTIGEGPCLEAITNNMLIDGSAAQLRRRWPALGQVWTEATPYRSALSVPVPLAIDVGCSLNLYFIEDSGAPAIDLMSSVAVGLLIATELLTAAAPPPGPDQPLADWMLVPSARRRQQVWVALGRITLTLAVSSCDGLDLLRSRAFAQGRTLDELVDALVLGADVQQLLAI